MEIKEITKEQANQLLKSGEKTGRYAPLGLFIMKDNDVWIGFANEYGDCFVEENSDKNEIVRWLNNEISHEKLYQ